MTQVRISRCQLLVVLKQLLCIFVFVAVVFIPSLLHYYTGDSRHDIIFDIRFVVCSMIFLVFIMGCLW